jgi:hypothetical protein
MFEDTLFTDESPNVDLEILKNLEPFNTYDPYYVVSGAIPERRLRFDTLWRQFKELADTNFKIQIKKQFHNRTWEMYLGCCLKANGYLSLGKDKSTPQNEGPDFILEDGTYIECVACTWGKVPINRGFSTKEKTIINDVPTKQIQLRITTALEDKKEQYDRWNKKKMVQINFSLHFGDKYEPWVV